MKSLLILSALATVPGFAAQAAASSDAAWKEIIVLQSTRDDVERLLGKSKCRGYDAAYNLEEGHIDIEYSAFNFCEQGKEFGWNVSEWTVVEVSYRPNNPPRFSSLKLDLTRFKRARENPCCPDIITYRNVEEGVAYTVNLEGTLHTIEYFPSSRNDDLRCKARGK
jgi:hypothetical protein